MEIENLTNTKDSDIKSRKVKLPKGRFFCFVVGFMLLIIVLASAIFNNGGNIQKLLSKIGFYNVLRTSGLAGKDLNGFFKALQSQNLSYDYNNDGVVAGDDFNLMVEKIGLSSISDIETVQTTDVADTSASGSDEITEHLPTIRGFSTNEFEGSSTADFSIDVPVAAANVAPSIGLTYSSGSVDDLQTGTPIWFRNGNIGSDDPNKKYASYVNQAGIAGLGWNLNTGGTISFDGGNNNYVMSIDGSSVDLILATGSNYASGYSEFRTDPDLQIKVERYQLCYYVKTKDSYRLDDDTIVPAVYVQTCRSQWYVTKGDGTKYFYGNNLENSNSWKRIKDPTSNLQLYTNCVLAYDINLGITYYKNCEEIDNVDWYPLYDSDVTDGGSYTGSGTWTLRSFGCDIRVDDPADCKYYANAQTYFLNEVKKAYANAPVINYDTKLVFSDAYPWNLYSTYPYRITYGNNQIDFITEPRLDYKISSQSDPTIQKYSVAKERLKKIKISSLGKVYKVYDFEYVYGWNPSIHSDINQNTIPDDSSEVIVGRAVHSLLTKITPYSDDPSVNSNASKLPPTTFSYGQDCEGFTGGCPLKSYTINEFTYLRKTAYGTETRVTTNYPTARTSNDFFLQSVENGYGAKIEYNYWSGLDASGVSTNALLINTCDYTGLCKSNEQLPMNLQRHRIESKIVYDGMGDKVKTQFNYTKNIADGYTKQLYTFSCNPDYIVCKYCNEFYSESKCYCEDQIDIEDEECRYDIESKSLADFRFLGYPEVETIVYDKNSTSSVVAKSVQKYHQNIKETGCFKPSPLKGVGYESVVYNINDSGRYSQSITDYSVRFGYDLTNYKEIADDNLNSYCSDYSLYSSTDEITKNSYLQAEFHAPVTMIMKNQDNGREIVSGSPVLCTKSTYDYKNLDGSIDPYSNLHKTVNFGSVDCSTGADIDEKPVISVSDFTLPKADSVWMTPKMKENWTTDISGIEKYNHAKNYFDDQSFGVLGNYGNLTKTEKIIDGSVYSTDRFVFSGTYPWQNTEIIDTYGRKTVIVYDELLRMFPTKTTNSLGHEVKMEYDFNTLDSTHPNYQGNKGQVIKTTDTNGAVTTNVYDEFGRLTEVYNAGKTPAVGVKPNKFIEYYYYNSSDLSTSCTASNHCLLDLGKQIGGLYGPKMVVYQGTRYSSDGDVGKIAVTHTFYNGLGQKVQNRNLWYDGYYSKAGVLAADEGYMIDTINSEKYNALGNSIVQSGIYTSNPYVPSLNSSYDTRDWVSDTTIPKNRAIYDGFGRTIESIMPDGTKTKMAYDIGNNPLKTSVDGPNCNDADAGTLCLHQIEIKNVFGSVIENQQIQDDGTKTYTTKIEYNPVLNLPVKTIDTLGNINSIIGYDKLGRKTKMWDIDMSPSLIGDENSWRYEYDKKDNIVKQTDPKGIVTEIVYDILYRPISKKVQGTEIMKNQYDNCLMGKGRLCKVDSFDLISKLPVSSSIYEYDLLGRLSKSSTQLSNMPDSIVNGKVFSTGFTYDEGGRLLTTAITGGDSLNMQDEIVTNEYQQPYLTKIKTSLTDSSPYYLSYASYTKNGQISKYTSGDNTDHSYNYDNMNNRLTSIYATNAVSGNDYIYTDYTYDTSGNITSIQDGLSSDYMSQNFVYDYLNRLVSVNGAYSASYAYDDIGNITQKIEGDNNVFLSYGDYSSGYYHRPKQYIAELCTGDTSDCLQSDLTGQFSYDPLGNMLADADKAYEYDNAGRLVKAIVPQEELPTVTPTPTMGELEVSADANGDGVVDYIDYNIWKDNYGNLTNLGITEGDFNMDGKVDGVDFNIWRIQFGQNQISPTPSLVLTSTPTFTLTPSPIITPTPTSIQGISPTPTSIQGISPTPTPILSCSEYGGICRSTRTGCIYPEIKINGLCSGSNICCFSN